MNESYRKLADRLGLYLLNEEQIPLAAECNAQAYEGYELYDILFKNRCTPAKVNRLWEVNLKLIKNVGLILADGPQIDGMAVFMPPGYTGMNAASFLRAGGLKLPISIFSMLINYQNFCTERRAKHTNHESWYLFDLAIRPQAYNRDLANNLIKPVLDYIRDEGRGCFVETQEPMEVGFYEHLGFDLVETSKIPGTDYPMYFMYRSPEDFPFSE